ncbi:alkaline-phosphatase-like protein [Aspergillus ambiguus]|uniref:mannose-ethanolamine phosphotransferase LAS21 n=1 Tax=Aspergillus ambiguus TaxID=176160 RepID=UPI003CCE3844
MPVISGCWAISIANILVPIAVLIFASGFFPYKPLIPGLATFEDDGGLAAPPGVFDKVVFMVIDALRSDFVYSNDSGFSFTQSLIRSGAAVPFTAYASSPTVTMPRLKAITTGSVPSFLDVILNIAESDTSSTLAFQDTWLAQLKARGDQLVMYGDDTWLKLFPGMFGRFDGTTSFFVSDFTEVDNNVTRHVPDELVQSDWSALIMHYLGLDHIGHKSGPRSPYMMGKQEEMDSIVEMVYTAMQREEHLGSTLFVLCGDHGMNDAGNHGGSSVGETSPALLFISPKFQNKGFRNKSPVEAYSELQYYHTVEQSDLTPTLSGLLGLPVPLNSLGVFIPELLPMWEQSPDRINMLWQNSRQLLGTVKEAFPGYNFESQPMPAICKSELSSGVDAVLCAWLQILELSGVDNSTSSELTSDLETCLLTFMKRAQTLMSSAASNYNLGSLYFGMVVTVLAVSLSFPATYRAICKTKYPGIFFLSSILGYSCIMFASSYVEEEQQFWYWLFTAWVFYLHSRSFGYNYQNRTSDKNHSTPRVLPSTLASIGLAASHRILRRWNQTGQKFSAEPDIAGSFFPSHQYMLWALIAITYADRYIRLVSHRPRSIVWHLVTLSVTMAALLFKFVFALSDSPELLDSSFAGPVSKIAGWLSLVWHARVVLLGILALVMFPTGWRSRSKTPSHGAEGMRNTIFHEALTLLLMNQSRATNIPLFLIFRFQADILASMDMTLVEQAITSLLFQYMTFFAFGGSNSISSVDLSNAYNGIGSYSVVFVGILTYISNWAGPIWWVSASQLLRSKSSTDERHAHLAVLTFHVTSTLAAVMAACTILRTHLFIWTVFSPKFLYTIAWAVINHLLVNTLGETCFILLSNE